MSQEDIENSLREVLFKPSYKKNADKRSSLFKDQKDKPLDRAIFWCEWLMRHPHDFKEIQLSRIGELGWFAANSYDILLFFASIILVIYLLLKKMMKKLFGSKNYREGKRKNE